MNALKIVAILSCLLITACGWQLRGYDQYLKEGDQMIDRLNVSSTIDNRLFQLSLQQMLRDRGIEITSDAPLTITLLEENTISRPLSYSSTGIPIQYQLIMSIRYRVSKGSDANYIEENHLIARRQYDFDTALIVAKREEENKLLEEMRDELSARILSLMQKQLLSDQLLPDQ